MHNPFFVCCWVHQNSFSLVIRRASGTKETPSGASALQTGVLLIRGLKKGVAMPLEVFDRRRIKIQLEIEAVLTGDDVIG